MVLKGGARDKVLGVRIADMENDLLWVRVEVAVREILPELAEHFTLFRENSSLVRKNSKMTPTLTETTVKSLPEAILINSSLKFASSLGSKTSRDDQATEACDLQQVAD